MREIFAATPHPGPSRLRLALLPGAYQSPEDFVSAGFVDALASRGLPVDLSFLDIELDVLTDRTALTRLRDEVVLPARAHGYAQIWLGGISLGGYVALDYASSAAAFAHAEIDRAGGLRSWQPGALAESDEERRIWRFIKHHGSASPAIYLGCGREDRFAEAQALLGSELPARNVDVVPGGHEWPTWRRLWENFLDSEWLCSGP
jgi:hypothetical protein